MAKVEVRVEKSEKGHSPAFDMARRVLLAGVGAVALTQDEVVKIVDRLVERGEVAQHEGQKLVKEVVERRRQDAKKAEDVLDKRVEEILARMNVPTKADIDALGAKITALTKKVEELKNG